MMKTRWVKPQPVFYAQSGKPFAELVKALAPSAKKLKGMGWELEVDPPQRLELADANGGRYPGHRIEVRATKDGQTLAARVDFDADLLNTYQAESMEPFLAAMVAEASA